MTPETQKKWQIRDSMAQLRDDASTRGYNELAILYSISCVQLGTEVLIEVATEKPYHG